MEGVEAFGAASELVAGLVAPLHGADLEAPTPCEEWSVGELIGALTAKTMLYAATPAEAQSSKEGLTATVTADPAAEYRAAATALAAAFADPARLADTMTLPIGDVPGSTVIEVALLDTMLHAWDLAVATGRPLNADPALIRATRAAAGRLITDDLRAAAEFAPVQPVPPGATEVDELVAFAGRDPRWTPPAA